MFPEVIKNLDLEPMMVKAMDADEGFGWDLATTKVIAEEYRKYLTLCLENPDDAIVPSSMVDDFWHLHILDTRKYADDCQKVFGYFLHHFPYFGMRSAEDANELRKAWHASCKKYEQRFGKADEAFWQNSARCPKCGKTCKNDIGDESRPRLVA